MNKPHIKLIGGVWRCQSGDVMCTGQAPRQAYNRWLEATIKAGLEHAGQAQPLVDLPKPKRQPAQRRPQKPVIKHCIGKSWQGLFPPKQTFGQRAAPAMSESERRKQEFLRMAGHGGHGGNDNRTIDMEPI